MCADQVARRAGPRPGVTDGEAAAAIALRAGFGEAGAFSSKAEAQRALQNKLAGSESRQRFYTSRWPDRALT
jgi:hypothetical protein